MMTHKSRIAATIFIVLVFLCSTILYLQQGAGPRSIGTIENIYGIPYPPVSISNNNTTLITEPLAHADIYLDGTPLAKKLKLTVTYTPSDITRLDVGIRENSFWLSYPKYALPITQGPTTQTIYIPLTDKLPDADGSVDLMFFASPDTDSTWQLHELKAATEYARPSWNEVKNYLKSRLTKEVPL